LLAETYRSYLDRTTDATEEQRKLLLEEIRSLNGENISPEVRSVLYERYGPKPRLPRPMPPHRTDPRMIALLVDRVEAYYDLRRDEKFVESWTFMSPDYRETHNQDGYVRTAKTAEDDYNILGWQVLRVQVSGDTAKVFLKTRRNERVGIWRRRETLDEESSFWVYENENWFMRIPGPVAWENHEMVEVPVLDDKPP